MNNKREKMRAILIVEDDESTSEFYVQAIAQETAYRAQVVSTGQDALKAVREWKPCLMILDYHLPDMNGIEVYDEMQALGVLDGVSVVLVSASERRDMIATRNMVILNKPFELGEFLRVIEELVDPSPVCQ